MTTRSRLPALLAAAALCAAAVAASGCEYVVDLDRGLVDAGGDAGCPICSGTDDDAGDAGETIDAEPADATAASGDAGADATLDAGSD